MLTRNKKKRIFAAILIIGDEILSGRTQDTNTSFLAKWLNERGVQLKEVRIIPDKLDTIILSAHIAAMPVAAVRSLGLC
jgi:molybdopterin-biosynthesis enzyme MoeA-like protein